MRKQGVTFSKDQAETFAQVYFESGDPVKAYQAVHKRSRLEHAKRRGPIALRLPVVQSALKSLAPQSVNCDVDPIEECKRLLADPGLGPRDRLAAIKEYARLTERQVGADSGVGFCPELRAFLRDAGVSIDGL